MLNVNHYQLEINLYVFRALPKDHSSLKGCGVHNQSLFWWCILYQTSGNQWGAHVPMNRGSFGLLRWTKHKLCLFRGTKSTFGRKKQFSVHWVFDETTVKTAEGKCNIVVIVQMVWLRILNSASSAPEDSEWCRYSIRMVQIADSCLSQDERKLDSVDFFGYYDFIP